jgi:hypothetical protein
MPAHKGVHKTTARILVDLGELELFPVKNGKSGRYVSLKVHTIFLDGDRKGHLKDGRQVIEDIRGNWIYYAK